MGPHRPFKRSLLLELKSCARDHVLLRRLFAAQPSHCVYTSRSAILQFHCPRGGSSARRLLPPGVSDQRSASCPAYRSRGGRHPRGFREERPPWCYPVPYRPRRQLHVSIRSDKRVRFLLVSLSFPRLLQ